MLETPAGEYQLDFEDPIESHYLSLNQKHGRYTRLQPFNGSSG